LAPPASNPSTLCGSGPESANAFSCCRLGNRGGTLPELQNRGRDLTARRSRASAGCGGLLVVRLNAQTHRWALAATFAPLGRKLCRGALCEASSSLCLRSGGLVGDGVEFRLGVAHGLSQHRTKLVFGRRLRPHVRFRGCAHP
jgi:hypothetical protein